MTVCDYLINDLKVRFTNSASAQAFNQLEELLIAGIQGRHGALKLLKDSVGFQRNMSVVEENKLSTEFTCAAMCTDVKAVRSLSTLANELKKTDLDYLWALAKNVLFRVQTMLCLMPTRISAERSFSVLDRVKTKLRNSMGDDRIFNLPILATHSDMVENMGVVALCNKLMCETSCTSRRLMLFDKCASSDLEPKANKKIEDDKLDAVDEPPQFKFASV